MRRKVEDKSVCDLATKAKLALVKLLKEKGSEGRYLDVSDKGQRRMRMIRGGTANREVSTYGERDLEKAEDVKHWLLEYERWRDEWVDLFHYYYQ